MSPIESSLWITLIGMSLVFLGLLLLWGLMELIVRAIKDPSPAKGMNAVEEASGIIVETRDPGGETENSDYSLKARAAAAVAAALAAAAEENNQKARALTSALLSTGRGLSPWQTQIRAHNANRPVTRR